MVLHIKSILENNTYLRAYKLMNQYILSLRMEAIDNIVRNYAFVEDYSNLNLIIKGSGAKQFYYHKGCVKLFNHIESSPNPVDSFIVKFDDSNNIHLTINDRTFKNLNDDEIFVISDYIDIHKNK